MAARKKKEESSKSLFTKKSSAKILHAKKKMPHPTIAEFKNLYGDVIHRLPVDIGDEFSSESLAKEFRLFPSYMLNDPKVHEVHMYGRSFFHIRWLILRSREVDH